MNRFIKIISAILVCIMVLGVMSGCSGSKVVMTIGDREITAQQYKTSAISIKSQFLSSNGLEESDSLWEQYIDSSYTSTTQEYLDSMIQSYFITYNLYAIHFEELGLKLDDDVIAKVEDTMKQFEKQAGSREAFEKNLEAQGFTYEQFADQYYNEAKKQAVILYYFGTDGKETPVSDEDLRLYFEEYYTKVKHVFLSTKDKDENDLSNPEKDKVGQKAQGIYERAVNGEDFDKLIDEYGEDPGMATNPDGYIFSSEDTSYTAKFHNAAFDMEPGEVRLIQTNLGYHVMKKLPITDEELYSKDTYAPLVETMMGSEIADVLERLKEEIGVVYNNKLLAELSVVNLVSEDSTEGSEIDQMTEDLKNQLGIETEEK